jgi:hypothetical protein
MGKERYVAGGVFDQSTHEVEGPVTRETLASPRHTLVGRRAGEELPTHDCMREPVSSANRHGTSARRLQYRLPHEIVAVLHLNGDYAS